MTDELDFWKPEKDLVEAISPRLGAIVKYMDAFRARAERNAQTVLDDAAAATGLEAEELLGRISDDQQLLVLLATTVEAAQRATTEHKVHALGKALAVGVLQEDDAAIDEAQILVATLRDLEAPHIRALAQIASLSEPRLGLEWGDMPPVKAGWSSSPDTPNIALTAPILAAVVRHGLVQAFSTSQGPQLRAGGVEGMLDGQLVQTHYATRFGHRLLEVLREAESLP